MVEEIGFNLFVNNSYYCAPVDKKKLEFIFLQINIYKKNRNLKINDLNILEIGSGKGGITLALVSLGCQVTAIDINRKSVEYLKKLAIKKRLRNLDVSRDDGTTFVNEKSYDIIIASEVFEHVRKPLTLIKNIVKRMKPGSYVIVTTPNGYGPWELKNRLNLYKKIVDKLKKSNFLRLLYNKSPYVETLGSGHCQYYTKRRLERMFLKHSLVMLNSANSDSFLTAISSLFRKNSFWGNIDVRLADVLPYWMASGWYFVFELHNS